MKHITTITTAKATNEDDLLNVLLAFLMGRVDPLNQKLDNEKGL